MEWKRIWKNNQDCPKNHWPRAEVDSFSTLAVAVYLQKKLIPAVDGWDQQQKNGLAASYSRTGYSRTTIGAEVFHTPVRNGKVWDHLAMATKPEKIGSQTKN